MPTVRMPLQSGCWRKSKKQKKKKNQEDSGEASSPEPTMIHCWNHKRQNLQLLALLGEEEYIRRYFLEIEKKSLDKISEEDDDTVEGELQEEADIKEPAQAAGEDPHAEDPPSLLPDAPVDENFSNELDFEIKELEDRVFGGEKGLESQLADLQFAHDRRDGNQVSLLLYQCFKMFGNLTDSYVFGHGKKFLDWIKDKKEYKSVYRSMLRHIGSRNDILFENAIVVFSLWDAYNEYINQLPGSEHNGLVKAVKQGLNSKIYKAAVRVRAMAFFHLFSGDRIGTNDSELGLFFLDKNPVAEMFDFQIDLGKNGGSELHLKESQYFDKTIPQDALKQKVLLDKIAHYREARKAAFDIVFDLSNLQVGELDMILGLIKALFLGMAHGDKKRFRNFYGGSLPGGKFYNPSDELKEQLATSPTSNDLLESLFGLYDRLCRLKLNASDLSVNGCLLWIVNKVAEELKKLKPSSRAALIQLCVKNRAADAAAFAKRTELYRLGRLASEKEKGVEMRKTEHSRLIRYLQAVVAVDLLGSSGELEAKMKDLNDKQITDLMKTQVRLLKARGLPSTDAPKFTRFKQKVPTGVIAGNLGVILDAVAKKTLSLKEAYAWRNDWRFVAHGEPTALAALELKDEQSTRVKMLAEARLLLIWAQKQEKIKKAEKIREAEEKTAEKIREAEEKRAAKTKEAEQKKAEKTKQAEEKKAEKEREAKKKEDAKRKEVEEKKAAAEEKKMEKQFEKEIKNQRAAEKKKIEKEWRSKSKEQLSWMVCSDEACAKWRVVDSGTFTDYKVHGDVFDCENVCVEGCRTRCDACVLEAGCDCPEAMGSVGADQKTEFGAQAQVRAQGPEAIEGTDAFHKGPEAIEEAVEATGAAKHGRTLSSLESPSEQQNRDQPKKLRSCGVVGMNSICAIS